MYDLTIAVYENEYIFTSMRIKVANNIKELTGWNKYCFLKWENNPNSDQGAVNFTRYQENVSNFKRRLEM